MRSPSPRSAGIRRAIDTLLILYGLGLAVLLYTPTTEWLAQPLYRPPSPPQTVDAIVVMEAWAEDDGELNESGLRRALKGAELFKAAAAQTVVLTGLKRTPTRTGSALLPMHRLLVLAGVPQSAIVIEDASADTHDSARHVGELARDRGWRRIVLVTDAGHMIRASRSFLKEGLTVATAPTMLWDLGGAQPSLRLRRLGILLHEYAGLAYYWWRGWS